MRFLLRDLAPGADYTVQLRENDGAKVSDWSRQFPLITVVDSIAPATPGSPAWVVNGSAFAGSWDAVTTNEDSSPCTDLSYYLVILNGTKEYRTVSTSFDLTFDANKAAFGTADPSISFVVKAVDGSGNQSDPTGTITATNSAPDTPSGLTATGVVGAIALQWDAEDIDDLKAYEIYASTDSGFTPSSLNLAGKTIGNTFSFETGNYATHYFKVRAVDMFDQGSSYATANAAAISPTAIDIVAPDTPTGLDVTMQLDSDDNSIAIAVVVWDANDETDLAGYTIRYKDANTSYYDYVDAPATVTNISIPGLKVGVTYTVAISAYDNFSNKSAFSSSDTATATNLNPSTPAAPDAVASTQSVQVSHNVDKAAGGRLENDVAYLEVYLGTSSGFTADATTYIGNIQVERGSSFVSGVFSAPVTDSTQSRWVRVIAVDDGGLKSAQSAVDAVTVGLIENANIANATITTAKISDLEANKITAGTGIVNNLDVKSTLKITSASGYIASASYISSGGTSGFRLDETSLIIKSGSIEAAALLLQDSVNIMRPEHADFEFFSTFYADGSGFKIESTGYTVTAAVANSGDIAPKFGLQSLKATRSGSGSVANVYLGTTTTDYNINVLPSETYIFSGYVLTKTGTGDKTYSITVKPNSGSPTTVVSGATATANSTWTRVSGTVTIPGGATAVEVYMSLGTNGDIYFDGFQLERKIAASNSASQWKPPSYTTINGGQITTGSIRSSATVTVNSVDQPAWSINTTGGAQMGDLSIRGKIIVGNSTVSTDADAGQSLVTSANFSTGTAGWQIKSNGDAEFNNIVARGSIMAAILTTSTSLSDTGRRIILDPESPIEHTGNFYSNYPPALLFYSGHANEVNPAELAAGLTPSAGTGQPLPYVQLTSHDHGQGKAYIILRSGGGGTPSVPITYVEIGTSDSSTSYSRFTNSGLAYYSASTIVTTIGTNISTTNAIKGASVEVLYAASGTAVAFKSNVSFESNDRFQIDASGKTSWGAGGASAVDTNLYRSAANTLKTDDSFNVNDVAVLSASTGEFTEYGDNTFSTYTPTVANGGSVTWTTRTGWYMKIGKMVFVSIHLTVNAAGSGTGTAVTITAPSTISGATSQVLAARAYETRTGYAIHFGGTDSTLFDRLRTQQTGTTDAVDNIEGADLTAGSTFNIQGWYREA